MNAWIVPAEIEGDIMYAGGHVFRRGRVIDMSAAGTLLFEWFVIDSDELEDDECES